MPPPIAIAAPVGREDPQLSMGISESAYDPMHRRKEDTYTHVDGVHCLESRRKYTVVKGRVDRGQEDCGISSAGYGGDLIMPSLSTGTE